jgi:hypothetical protein
MMKPWKLTVLLGLAPLAWGGPAVHAQAHPHPHSGGGTINVTPGGEEEGSVFAGHYQRIGKEGTPKASLDIVQVGPDLLRVRGLVDRVEAGKVTQEKVNGTARPERLKAQFESLNGCKLDILFQAEGLKVENAAPACGPTFDGEYKRTGPSEWARDPTGGH